MKKDILNQLLEGLGGQRRIKYTLDRVKMALAKLGNPERDVYTLVISGTNGKGTTSLLVSSCLSMTGYKVGTFLSPHLCCPTERFLKNLFPIPKDTLTQLAQDNLNIAQECELTYFEFLALIYFLWAKTEKLDFSVLEVGLGGRLDATNVTNPLGSIITNISLDHQAFLGHKTQEILEEKLGILGNEGLLFTGITEPELRGRVEKRCLELDAIAYYSEGIRRKILHRNWNFQSVLLNGYPFLLNNPSLGTLDNTALAFLALRILFPKIPIHTLQKSFSSICTPGRFEVVSESPRIIISGDHNPAGLENTLSSLQGLETGKLFVICGFSPDKPYIKMVQRLREVSHQTRVTRVRRFYESMPEDYSDLPMYHPDFNHCLNETLETMNSSDTLLITGSLYLVGEVRPIWRPKVDFCKAPSITPEQSSSEKGASIQATIP